MKDHEITAAFARCLIQNTRSFKYSEGFLIDLPFTYLDGDAVRLYVEPTASGFRVTDRGDAILNLGELGISTGTGKPKEYIESLIEAHQTDRFGAEDYEISELSDSSDLGCVIGKVASVAMRVDTLRLLAKTETSGRFVNVVSSRIREAFEDSASVKLRAPMPQTGSLSRSRQVTASVTRKGRTAFIYAISSRTPDTPVSKAFRAFSRAAVEFGYRFSALEGVESSWREDDLGDLESVSTVSFDGHRGDELINQIDLALAPSLV